MHQSLGAVNVAEAARACGVARLFHATKPNVWRNTYSITKIAAESFMQMANESGPTEVFALRYFNAFGAGQAIAPIRKILPMFAALALRGRPLQVYGDGTQIVDMIYARDLAEHTVRFTRSGRSDIIPDCGSGEGISVNDVARAVNAHFENDAGIRHLPMRPGEVERTVLTADLSDLRAAIGNPRQTDYATAIRESLDWYSRLPKEQIDHALAYYDAA